MLSVEEVKKLAISSSIYDFDTSLTEVKQAIRSVQDSIEQYFEFPVTENTFNEYVEDWEFTQIGDHYRISPSVTPVISVATEHIRFNDKNIIFSAPVESFQYTAGYRNGRYPEDMKRIAFRLIMYELGYAQGDLFTVATKTVVTGNTVSHVTQTRENVYRDELAKLSHYKKWLANSRYVEQIS